MPNLAASDVIYTERAPWQGRYLEGLPPHFHVKVNVAFGDSLLIYPPLGIALIGNKLGFPNGVIEDVRVLDDTANPGITWRWDDTNKTLRGYFSGSGAQTLTLDDQGSDVSVPVVYDTETHNLAIPGGAINVGVIAGTTTGAGTEIAGAVPPTTLILVVLGW